MTLAAIAYNLRKMVKNKMKVAQNQFAELIGFINTFINLSFSLYNRVQLSPCKLTLNIAFYLSSCATATFSKRKSTPTGVSASNLPMLTGHCTKLMYNQSLRLLRTA